MPTTEWYPPDSKPVRVGWWESAIFDGGWIYEWRIWFDGETWRDKPEGWALFSQAITWRGLTTEQKHD